jgi:hypothetical protein
MADLLPLLEKAKLARGLDLVGKYGDFRVYRAFSSDLNKNSDQLELCVAAPGLEYIFGVVTLEKGAVKGIRTYYPKPVLSALLEENPDFPLTEEFQKYFNLPAADPAARQQYRTLQQNVWIHENEGAILSENGAYRLYRTECSETSLTPVEKWKEGSNAQALRTEGLRYCCGAVIDLEGLKSLIHARGTLALERLLPSLIQQAVEPSGGKKLSQLYCVFNPDGLKDSGMNPFGYIAVAEAVLKGMGLEAKVLSVFNGHEVTLERGKLFEHK